MAECHPVGFQWVMEAQRRGAKVIHVDPRFTRTSAVADLHVPLRAGSDIAFLGGIVNHILTNGREFRDYVVNYTNAPMIIDERFEDTEDLDGLFSGFDPSTGSYDNESWQYQDQGAAPQDRTLQHPRCVFQLLRRHFARYTPELVEELCGVPRSQFLEVADALCDNSGPERTGAFCYAVGWTQHTVGVQYIRTAAIIQLLLGNIGRPGGGILALRGHASIQGSTDIPTLFNILPGYLPMPRPEHATLDDYVRANSSQSGSWADMRAYLVSLLRAYFGDAATADNDWCFGRLPRITGDHSTYQSVLDMVDNKLDGFLVLGENPAVGSANGRLHRLGLANLDWMVVRDFQEIETASFWHGAPEIATGELRTEDIGTEVFFLPAATHTEKDGTFTNTQRLLQWHDQAVQPRHDVRSDLWFAYHLGRIIREKLADSEDPRDRPIADLAWDYPLVGPHDDPAADAVLREINGTDADGRLLSGYAELADDGSTSCGCWIYSGCYAGGVNQTRRRTPGDQQSWVAPEWGWAWPMNRRILYNRASADPQGNAWSDRKAYVWWDAEAGAWTGADVPDFPADKLPGYEPPPGATGLTAHRGDAPFVMQADGLGWLFVPSGLVDGPLPAHYEPHESPFVNSLYGQRANPTRQLFHRADNPSNPAAAEDGAARYPFVMTTYRLTEHHTAGGMSRFVGHLAELQPEMFCEVSPQLAELRGLTHGGWATIISTRSAIEARVLVTDRVAPLRIQGRTVHQVGLPYHWGSRGLVTGDSANDLFGLALDPNVHIQEVKAATCDVVPGRRPQGAAVRDLVDRHRPGVAATGEEPS
jgi:formate dehydrogenase major subunit